VAESLHPLEAAQDELDVCAPVLTGDPTTNTAAVVGASEADKKLEGLSDEFLLRKAIRESMITLIVLLEETRRQGPRLMATRPAELGVLVKGLTAFLTAANDAGCQLLERQHRERRAAAEAEADRERRERLRAMFGSGGRGSSP
jgi:hypothetical protein